MAYPKLDLPARASVNTAMLVPPLPEEEAQQVELVKGPNVSDLPDFDPLPDDIEAPVLLKVGDNVSTDEISPAGRALPFRSNIPKLAEFTYTQVDETYPERAAETASGTGHVIVGGENYGQGSSREHAAITPRYLGLRVVIAKSFARIHWQNLANFGILALEFEDPADYDRIAQDDVLRFDGLRDALDDGSPLIAHNQTQDVDIKLCHRLSPRQVEAVLAGGVIPLLADAER
jgi:aconitate hydratase